MNFVANSCCASYLLLLVLPALKDMKSIHPIILCCFMVALWLPLPSAEESSEADEEEILGDYTEDIKFFLWTRANPENHTTLVHDGNLTSADVLESGFNSELETKGQTEFNCKLF